jgi:hypothetical protein
MAWTSDPKESDTVMVATVERCGSIHAVPGAYCRLCATLPQLAAAPRGPCAHLGTETGERVLCPSCTGKVEVKVLNCAAHGRCTVGRQAGGLSCCATCPNHKER